MENELLEDLDRMTFNQQKEAFYTAYSKYMIVDTDTMLIAFSSAGVMDLLYPQRGYNTSTNDRNRVIGQDIFKFLGFHTANGLARDYKARVKNALKAGMAISTDLHLSTRRTMTPELFATHWTPLKNEFNAMGFVVMTLSSQLDKNAMGR